RPRGGGPLFRRTRRVGAAPPALEAGSPRHWLHAGLGDRRRTGQGTTATRRRAARRGLRAARTGAWLPARRRALARVVALSERTAAVHGTGARMAHCLASPGRPHR